MKKIFFVITIIIATFSVSLAQNNIKKTYYDTGELECEFPLTAHGIIKCYHKNGKLRDESTFIYGKIDGLSKEYYEDGSLHKEIHYKNGKRDGDMVIYNENSQTVWAYITYENDKAISGECGNGRIWTDSEVSNWNQGLNVSCSQK